MNHWVFAASALGKGYPCCCCSCFVIDRLVLFVVAAYVSLETVCIDRAGAVSYRSVPEDQQLEVVYLAPELQQHGVVTEKVSISQSLHFI